MAVRNSIRRLIVCGSFAALAGVAIAQPVGVTGYEAVEVVPPPDHRSTNMEALDESGRLVGRSRNINYTSFDIVWINGETIELPLPIAGVSGISPTGGIIVGGLSGHPSYLVIDGPSGTLSNLPSQSCSASAVNSRGWIAGGCSEPYRSGLWMRTDPPVDLGTFPGGHDGGTAIDINELGEIVGVAPNACSNTARYYLWRPPNGPMIDIGGDPCNATVRGWGINNFSEVVGYMEYFGPFIWKEGHKTLLASIGNCGSTPNAINDSGLIVGESNPDPQCRNGRQHAVVWDKVDGSYVLFDVNDWIPRHPDLTLVEANDVNSAGQMVAFGEYDDGRERGFLVTPYLFEMSDPVPGIAGQPNTITVTGLVPNQRVLLAYGAREGAQMIRPSCPGGTLLIRDPHALPMVRADENGIATITMFIPPYARGRTIRMQAIAPFECEISHTVTWTFQ